MSIRCIREPIYVHNCDRCGDEFPEDNHRNPLPFALRIQNRHQGFMEISIGLCPPCGTALREFLKPEDSEYWQWPDENHPLVKS